MYRHEVHKNCMPQVFFSARSASRAGYGEQRLLQLRRVRRNPLLAVFIRLAVYWWSFE
jgi:hypothetical protein